jgi:putative hydrolase of the HAD superfamily
MQALWQVGGLLNYEYPARLAMLRALRRHLPRGDAAQQARNVLVASFECLIPRWRPYRDMFDTLHRLRRAGYRLGCISNTNDGTHVQRLVARFDLRRWLAPVLTSEEIGFRKPHPYIFDIVLSAWKLPAQDVIMVGDTLDADILGAHNAGMRGIWIERVPGSPWSNNNEGENTVVPDATIAQLSELPELLAGMGASR